MEETHSFAKLQSATFLGLNGVLVDVEVDLGAGLPQLLIVGLPDKAVEESKERVRAALRHAGFTLPQRRVTVNLAPADLKKAGPSFDLPIALGILAADGQIDPKLLNDTLIVGELALDGAIRHVAGVLPLALLARENGIAAVLVPEADVQEAAVVEGVKAIGAAELSALVTGLRAAQPLKSVPTRALDTLTRTDPQQFDEDFAAIRGQEHAKRALEIAAAGGHNILLVGPPGTGKTLLAKALRAIMPEMSSDEMFEVTRIYSVSGRTRGSVGLVTERPFRSPHHTASPVALVGGGSWPKPGEITLAHRGVLFLDEFPEFPRSVVEALRQPLETGEVFVSRAQDTVQFPAAFTFVAAMNPCPCGYLTDDQRVCTCSPGEIARYQKKISGPMLDRIDLHIAVPRVGFEKLTGEGDSEPATAVRARIARAREIAKERFASQKGTVTNATMNPTLLKKIVPLEGELKTLLQQAMERLKLSARAFHRTLKVARTIADLAGSQTVEPAHVAEALQYRRPDILG